MSSFNVLSTFCKFIHNNGTDVAMSYLGYISDWNDPHYTTYINRADIYSFYSLYQCCLNRKINIDKLFNDQELKMLFNLIRTINKMNLELAKQLLIIKIRECTTSNQKHS